MRTLTSNIALELAYATGDHRQALFSTGVVLLVIIMILNYIANFGIKRKDYQMRINPRIVDTAVKIGLNVQAFFTVGILVVIVGSFSSRAVPT